MNRARSLAVNPDWAKLPLFDRKGWRRVAFGEFAQSVNERENKALIDAADFDVAFEVKKDMILVTRANAMVTGIGRACMVDRTRPGLMLSDKTLRLVPDESIANATFLMQGLRSNPYRGYVERSANGTEAKNISQETLRKSPFWLPALSEQMKIVKGLNVFSNAIEAATQNVARLSTLRGSLVEGLVA